MKHEQAFKFYNHYINSLVYICDTLTKKDSIVISKFSKNSSILQKTIKSPRMVNYGNGSFVCVTDVREEFYNSRGLIEYVRNYYESCSVKIDFQNEDIAHAYLYERFEYDEDDNLIIRVFNISTPMTIKETYTIENAKWIKKRERINETDFWK